MEESRAERPPYKSSKDWSQKERREGRICDTTVENVAHYLSMNDGGSTHSPHDLVAVTEEKHFP